jgi:fatty acid amide hydrolase
MANDLLRIGAARAVAALDAREVSSLELTTALLDRLEQLQIEVRPMASIWREDALRAAQSSDLRRRRGAALSAFDGLPVTLKENLDVRGRESTLGVHAKVGVPAERDAVVVQVLREAGCVFLGKTNVSQFLLFHECSNPVFGVTRNPYALDRTPGGSSGGEAAAIAAHGSPGGLGTDIGGSVRVPAHFCGIAGIKPTVDRISGLGIGTALPGQEFVRGQVGPMGRSVDDVITLLRALSPEACARLDPRVPPLALGDPAAIDFRAIKVGFFVDDGIVAPSLAVQRAVGQAVAALRDAGAEVVPYSPPACREIILTYLAGLSADGGRTVERQLQGGPGDPNLSVLRTMAKLPSSVKKAAAFGMSLRHEPMVPDMLRVMGEKSVQTYWELTAKARALQVRVARAWTELGLDAVVCPPHATPALPHGASRDFTLGGALSMRYNFVNFPAGVVPVTRVRAGEAVRHNPVGRLANRAAEVDRGSEGLPVGVQVVARPYKEDLVLALMKAIESVVAKDPDYPRLDLA